MANENINQGPDPKQLREAFDFYKQLAQASGDLTTNTKETLSELKKVASAVEKIRSSYDITKKSALDIKSIENSIYEVKTKSRTVDSRLKDINEQVRKSAEKIAGQERDILDKIEKASSLRLKLGTKEYDRQQKLIGTYHSQLDVLNSTIDSTQAEALALFKVQMSLQEQLKLRELQVNQAKDAEKIRGKELRLTDRIAGSMKDNFGIMTKYYEELNKQIDRRIDGETTEINRWKILKTSVKEALSDPMIQFGLVMKAQNAIWDGIKKAFSFIVDIAKKAYDLLIGWNSQIFEFAKNLGIGEQAARGLQNSFLDMANTSGDLFFNTKQLREAYSTLTEASGLFLDNNKETTETAAILQRQFGLTAEHFGSIMDNSALSGKSFKDTYYTIDAIRQVEGSRTKSLMSQRQMMNEMAKVSSLVLLNFKGNVPALAAAVVKAHALGLSLDQVNATTNGFLDFETSIGKEFEAQLITGKDLNLQRLRYLSLTHDTAGLMAEIGKRIPSMLEFEKMNTIERQSYAEAMNMSEESLAEIIKKQELVHKYGIAENATAGETYNTLIKQHKTQDQIVDILGKQAAEQDRSASIADRWNSIVDNIKDTLGRMLEGELGGIIKSFQDMLQNSGFVHNMITKIQGVVHTISDFIKDLPKNMANVLHSTAKWLWILAGVQAAIGASLVGLAFVTGGATAGAGAGLLIGAAKTAAVAAAAGYAAGEIETLSISPAAAANQVGFRDNTSAATPSTTPTQNRVQPVTIQLTSTIQQEGHKVGQANQTVYYNLPAADSTNTHPYHTGGQTGASQTK